MSIAGETFLNAINKAELFLPNDYPKLLEVFQNWQNVWDSNDLGLFQKAGISAQRTEHFFALRKSINPEKEWKVVEKESITVIVSNDHTYPQQLKNIADPPPILYLKGHLQEETPKVAIVGTRKFSLYGKEVATEIAAELSNVGITIVSGLARGIDTFSHTACVERDNPTIAVLGSGVDYPSIYPPENRTLTKRIIETGGAIISEFSPGAEPLAHHFPQRNRIISGLSLGIIVIEAPIKSGALITAKFALEQGKEVFAVPGPINALNSEGTNMLIKNGAHPVTSAQDIIEVLGLEIKSQKSKVKSINEDLSVEEQEVLEALSQEPLHIDKIVERTKLPVSQVNAALTMLEMKDAVKHMGNNIYAKNS